MTATQRQQCLTEVGYGLSRSADQYAKRRHHWLQLIFWCLKCGTCISLQAAKRTISDPGGCRFEHPGLWQLGVILSDNHEMLLPCSSVYVLAYFKDVLSLRWSMDHTEKAFLQICVHYTSSPVCINRLQVAEDFFIAGVGLATSLPWRGAT